MLILGYDTATPWGTMALIEEETIIFEISLKIGKGSSEYLFALLQNLLKKAHRKIADIDLIAVGTGPGSYTGIRIGLAGAKGLAAGSQIPVYGLSTLRIIAENAHYNSQWIASLIDARHGFVYAALYQNNNGQLTTAEAPLFISAQELAVRLLDLPAVMLCGDGSKIYSAIWNQYSNFKIAPIDWDRPSGTAAARIGCKEFQIQNQTDLALLVPCYLRKVEAELRLEESQCNLK
jgi:tRNA threonylcarbamoyladenosine biosynthesis protein TsaB